MPEQRLLDTDVLIDYSRRVPEAVKFLRGVLGAASISAVTVAEMYAGIRDGKERLELDNFINATDVIPVDSQIAERAGLFLRQYQKSHGVGFADAVIAATSIVERARLVSLNLKHFPMLSNVMVPYSKP